MRLASRAFLRRPLTLAALLCKRAHLRARLRQVERRLLLLHALLSLREIRLLHLVVRHLFLERLKRDFLLAHLLLLLILLLRHLTTLLWHPRLAIRLLILTLVASSVTLARRALSLFLLLKHLFAFLLQLFVPLHLLASFLPSLLRHLLVLHFFNCANNPSLRLRQWFLFLSLLLLLLLLLLHFL